MSTRKSSIVLMTLRIKRFPIFILFPLRCLNEVLEGALDILSLFRGVSKKAYEGLAFAENAIAVAQSFGRLDLADIDVKSPEGRVKIKILLR